MRKLIYICLTLAALAIATSGCNTSGCTDNQNALPLAGFYSSASGQAISVTDFDIMGEGAPHDSLLYSTGVAYSEVYLPFRSTADHTAYLFTYYPDSVNQVTDRIAFTYTSEPHFASEECGVMYFYHITSMTYTTNLIDSVVIVDSLITNTEKQRLRIYFRTSTPQ